jgi:hypothetical protein
MHATESEVERIITRPWEYGGLPPRTANSLLLVFWSNVSLGIWSSWSVFSDGDLFFVRRIEWARGRDRIRVTGEAPTTFGAEVSIPGRLATSLLSRAHVLAAAPLLPEVPGITIDGVHRRLVVHAEQGELSVNWQAGTARAEHLDSWLEETANALNRMLPSSSAREAQSAA